MMYYYNFIMNSIDEISSVLSKMNQAEINQFLAEMLTESELSVLSKRWRILNMLSEGITQREIAKELNVGLCKVTRGAKIMKTKDSITNKYLSK
ncbi:TPA: transcriptional regulator [Candidatus Gastranaerophilales bacterium HUM_9]|nr:MAG TPA: transcriptional regulator [Candidatus Gastranaerophilales bacterium HUM_9]HBX34166.1 transcriptional regulator [Cyanobacteria bacterium UBA11440]